MRRSVLMYIKIFSIFIATVLGIGCATVPQREFKSYNDAFVETKNVTELLLLEYDAAKRAEDKLKAEKEPVPTSNSPYPPSVTITFESENGSSTDYVGARREALEVLSAFNALLMSLAEGKKPEEIKSSVDSLIGGLKNVVNLIGANLPIPYVGEIGSLISTVVAKLQEAQNRQQFVDALREAEPIISGILCLFARDAEDIYRIRAIQTDRLWSHHQDEVATFVRQMRAVTKEHAHPTGNQENKLAKIEKDARQVLDRVGLKNNSEKLPTLGTRAFDTLTLSQLEQTLVQAKAEAVKFQAVIRAQTALLELILSYGRLLSKTNSALTIVRTAIDAPSDIRKQAIEFVSFAFAVKRDWEALDAARRAAVSD